MFHFFSNPCPRDLGIPAYHISPMYSYMKLYLEGIMENFWPHGFRANNIGLQVCCRRLFNLIPDQQRGSGCTSTVKCEAVIPKATLEASSEWQYPHDELYSPPILTILRLSSILAIFFVAKFALSSETPCHWMQVSRWPSNFCFHCFQQQISSIIGRNCARTIIKHL